MQAIALTVILWAGVGQCDECHAGGGVHAQHAMLRGSHLASGPMPQTCYQPRYGCYHSNNRHMHRYPAFHGYYYRRPYNYRQLFDYPWHAEPHEPTSLFSYRVAEEVLLDLPLDARQRTAPPVPTVGDFQDRVSTRRSAAEPLELPRR